MAKRGGKYREGEERIVAVLGDEDTVTGFLLAGAGDSDSRKGQGPNYFVVHKTTQLNDIESAFRNFISRKDIAVIAICQHIADDIRYLIEEHKETIPCILEIPSKDVPYDPAKDVVLQKVNRALGKS